MIIPTEQLIQPLSVFMSTDRFALLTVTPKYEYINGQRTENINAVCYQVAHPKTYKSFEVKVPSSKPIISQDAINDLGEDEKMFVTFENAMVKPKTASYGKADCSVTADSVKLVMAD